MADTGFSLLEVLVALAIASLVAMAIGGLFMLTGELRTRAVETEQIEAALVSLQGMQSQLSRDLDLHIDSPSPTGFELVSGKASGASPAKAVTIRLEPADGRSRIEMISPAEGSLGVDLSPFQNGALEYLVQNTTGTFGWVAEDHSTGKPVAARLHLVFGARVWRPLLWIVALSSSSIVPAGAL